MLSNCSPGQHVSFVYTSCIASSVLIHRPACAGMFARIYHRGHRDTNQYNYLKPTVTFEKFLTSNSYHTSILITQAFLVGYILFYGLKQIIQSVGLCQAHIKSWKSYFLDGFSQYVQWSILFAMKVDITGVTRTNSHSQILNVAL